MFTISSHLIFPFSSFSFLFFLFPFSFFSLCFCVSVFPVSSIRYVQVFRGVQIAHKQRSCPPPQKKNKMLFFLSLSSLSPLLSSAFVFVFGLFFLVVRIILFAREWSGGWAGRLGEGGASIWWMIGHTGYHHRQLCILLLVLVAVSVWRWTGFDHEAPRGLCVEDWNIETDRSGKLFSSLNLPPLEYYIVGSLHIWIWINQIVHSSSLKSF